MTCKEFWDVINGGIRSATTAEMAACYKHYCECEECVTQLKSDCSRVPPDKDPFITAPEQAAALVDGLIQKLLGDPEASSMTRAAYRRKAAL